jgi:phosphoglycolate phosphatase
MIQKYRHISFDLDGTLVHTTPEYRHALVPRVVGELGGTIKEPRAVDRFWFEATRNDIIRDEFNIDPEKFWDLFHLYGTVEERDRHTHAYPDAERTLRELRRRGKGTSIITGSPQWIAEMEIGKLGQNSCDYRLCLARSAFPQKPDPKSFFHTLVHLKLTPEEVVYVGNSNDDAYFAKNAGVDFIYLERKEHEFQLDDYAVAKISSLDELLQQS